MAPQQKAASPWRGQQAASKTSICPNYTLSKRLLNTVAASIRHAYWMLSFSIEDASQRYALRKTGGAK